MSKRKKKKLKDETETVSKQDVLESPKIQNFTLEFEPVVLDNENGFIQNIHLFEKLLPVLEQYSDVFDDDSAPKLENYSQWLGYHLEFLKSVAPWVFVVMIDGEPQGLLWAINWGSNGLKTHSVEISGIANRKVNPEWTVAALKKLVDIIFNSTEVYIIRSSYTSNNRAAGWAVSRAGLSHPEEQRVCMIKNGQELTGIIKSITRPEWLEAQDGKR